jgi:tetratricopeptide (TPR) repeat protein
MGLAYAMLGQTNRAVELYEQHLSLAREAGDRRGEGNALWNLSLATDKLGDRSRAIAPAEDAFSIRREISDPNAEKVSRKLAEWKNEV